MSEEPQAWTLWGPDGPEPERWSWSLLVPGKYGRYSVSLCVDDPGEGGEAVRRIVRACRAYDDLLAACKDALETIDRHTDYGERECPFCYRHHLHDADCPRTLCAAAIAKAEEAT